MPTTIEDKLSYLAWYNGLSDANKIYLNDIGLKCLAEHSFFRFEILDLFGWLRSYKLTLNKELFEICIDRYIALIPTTLRDQIDRDTLKEDVVYRAWFFNRHCFYDDIEDILGRSNKATPYIQWSPVMDSLSPSECKLLHNVILDTRDDHTFKLIEDHWRTIKSGCRCGIGYISKYQQLKLGLKAP